MPNSQLRIALQQIEIGKNEVKLLNRQTELLQSRVELKDSIITACREEAALLSAISNNHRALAGNLTVQLKIAEGNVAQLKKQVRKQRTKTIFTSMAAIVAAALIILK